jgi:Antibiotic biosynthesis monooxygenase.
MISVIWEFTVRAESRDLFESAYGSHGIWAQLFRRDPAYRETILLMDGKQAGRYLTIDVWEDREAYQKFQERFAEEYKKIDSECEELTQSERHIGLFERLP